MVSCTRRQHFSDAARETAEAALHTGVLVTAGISTSLSSLPCHRPLRIYSDGLCNLQWSPPQSSSSVILSNGKLRSGGKRTKANSRFARKWWTPEAGVQVHLLRGHHVTELFIITEHTEKMPGPLMQDRPFKIKQ